MSEAPDETLSVWVVYDHPPDYPRHYVARRFIVNAAGQRLSTDFMYAVDIEAIRAVLRKRGLAMLARDPRDAPKIVEVWI